MSSPSKEPGSPGADENKTKASKISSHKSNTNNNSNNSNTNGNIATNNTNDDILDERPIPRRGRTPSIIVQSLNLNPQGGTSIASESIELNGDVSPSDEEDSDHDRQDHDNNRRSVNNNNNNISNNIIRNNDDDTDNEHRDNHDHVVSQLSEQLQNSSTNESPASGSSTSLYNTSTSSPPEPKPPLPNVARNRRLSLNIGTTVPRRLSLTVDSLPSFATATGTDASLQANYPGGSATGNPRLKVALKPGHSLMGWINYTSTAKNLSGTNGKIIEVTAEELAKHDKMDDCWVALKDNVYNVTSYLQYHPGGVDELMRGAGKDATELFNEIHMWVNFETILAKCLVGPFKAST